MITKKQINEVIKSGNEKQIKNLYQKIFEVYCKEFPNERFIETLSFLLEEFLKPFKKLLDSGNVNTSFSFIQSICNDIIEKLFKQTTNIEKK